MKRLIDYVMQDSKALIHRDRHKTDHTEDYGNALPVTNRDDGILLVTGKDCCSETAFNEFMATKNSWDKAKGVFFYHYDQSLKDGENISPKTAHELAVKFAEDNYPHHEVLISTHVDNQHLHSHFIINSVSFVDGKKLRQDPKTLLRLRAYSDEICKRYGLSVLEPYQTGQSKTLILLSIKNKK